MSRSLLHIRRCVLSGVVLIAALDPSASGLAQNAPEPLAPITVDPRADSRPRVVRARRPIPRRGQASRSPRRPGDVPAPRAAAAAGSSSPTGPVERGDGPVQGYRATRTTTGTKTDTALKDIPQEIVVIPRQLIDDTATTTDPQRALDYVGGFSRGNNFGGLNAYEANVRGLPTRNVAINGISTPRQYDVQDAANIERIEVMFGPSGALYGRNDPGGFYNIVTKQPLSVPYFAATASVGSYSTLRETIDGNIVSRDKTVAIRLNAAADNRDSYRDFVSSDRYLVAPVLRWQPTPDTRVTLEGSLVHDSRIFDRGVVAVNNRLDVLAPSRFLGEPSLGPIDIDNYLASVKAEHDFNSDWTARLTVQTKGGTLQGPTAETGSLAADQQTFLRRVFVRDFTSNVTTVQAEAVGRFTTGPLKHTLLLGTEEEVFGRHENYSQSATRSFPYSINIFNPVYGQATPPASPSSNVFYDSTTYSAYISDQIEITPRLKVQVGNRFNAYQQTARQAVTGQGVNQDLIANTPRGGVTFEIAPNVTLFADAGTSFRPNLDSDTGFLTTPSGGAYRPETGFGYEGGAKIDLLDGRVGLTAAAFDIVKNNVLTPDPANPIFNTVAGQVRSRGVDLNVSGQITPEWRVIGGYAHIDAKVTKDNVIPIGAPIANVPRDSGSLFSVYEFQGGPLRGLGLGAGVRAVGKFAGDSAGDNFFAPSYVKIDALAYYTATNNFKITLNVFNVTNERYYEEVRSKISAYPGQPRSFLLTAKYTF